MNKQKYIDLVNFFYETGTLRKIIRSHRQRFLTDDLSDNIASHSFRVVVIGFFLAQLEKADISKVLLMCLFHDISETRSGDLNWIHKQFVSVSELKIISGQMKNIPMGQELQAILDEYSKRISRESKIAKDADNLDQVLLMREYAWMGNKEAQLWERMKTQQSMLYSRSAKEIYARIYTITPSNWAHTIEKL